MSLEGISGKEWQRQRGPPPPRMGIPFQQCSGFKEHQVSAPCLSLLLAGECFHCCCHRPLLLTSGFSSFRLAMQMEDQKLRESCRALVPIESVQVSICMNQEATWYSVSPDRVKTAVIELQSLPCKPIQWSLFIMCMHFICSVPRDNPS